MDLKGKENIIVSVDGAKTFVSSAFLKLGASNADAELCADILVEADRRGHYSHGMNILHKIVGDIESGRLDVKGTPEILRETVSTAWITGNNGLGPVVADFCMKIAIEKAKNVGLGLVSVKCSNNPSIMGYWSEYALKEGCLGLTFTNAAAIMVPTRSKEKFVGPNPIAFAAPSKAPDTFSLDMATATVSGGKIEMARRKRIPIVKGWAFNEEGTLETDSEIAVKNLMLVPLGGLEITAGYKGYGLSLMVDILCGILSGSNWGPNIKRWEEDMTEPANLGHCFIAINIDNFAPYFQDRMRDFLSIIRKCEPVDLTKPVLIPGDLARMSKRKVARQKGISYTQQQINTCQMIAYRLNIKALQCVPSHQP